MNDYDRVAKLIRYIEANFRDQPDLDQLAKVAGLSTYHFHRLFRRWAQTTPKSYIQHLTVLEAGKMLRVGCPVLDTALEVGLSGPGRLHDLCVNLEAASPGEIRSGGTGWEITAGYCDTPFGEALIAQGPRGICKLSFVTSTGGRESEWDSLLNLWPKARFLRNDTATKKVSRLIFASKPKQNVREPLKLCVKGTDFQIKVWRALVRIPPGVTWSHCIFGGELQSRSSGRSCCRSKSGCFCDPMPSSYPCLRDGWGLSLGESAKESVIDLGALFWMHR